MLRCCTRQETAVVSLHDACTRGSILHPFADWGIPGRAWYVGLAIAFALRAIARLYGA